MGKTVEMTMKHIEATGLLQLLLKEIPLSLLGTLLLQGHATSGSPPRSSQNGGRKPLVYLLFPEGGREKTYTKLLTTKQRSFLKEAVF